MTHFHREHQQVFGQQQNAGNDIHNSDQSLTFGSVQSPSGLPALLAQLQSVVIRALVPSVVTAIEAVHKVL